MFFVCSAFKVFLSIIYSQINWAVKKLRISSKYHIAPLLKTQGTDSIFSFQIWDLFHFFNFTFLSIPHNSCINFLPSIQAKHVDGIQFLKLESLLSPLYWQTIQDVVLNNKKPPFLHIQNINIHKLTTWFFCLCASIIFHVCVLDFVLFRGNVVHHLYSVLEPLYSQNWIITDNTWAQTLAHASETQMGFKNAVHSPVGWASGIYNDHKLHLQGLQNIYIYSNYIQIKEQKRKLLISHLPDATWWPFF